MYVRDFIKKTEQIFPLEYSDAYVKEFDAYDNQGLLIGDENKEVNSVLCCMDCKADIVDEAIEKNVDLIFSHHPLIFYPIKNVTSRTILGKKIIKIIKNDICLYSSHLSLDMARFGVNDAIGEIIGEGDVRYLEKLSNGMGMGGIKTLKNSVSFSELLSRLCETFTYDKVRYYGKEKTVRKVAYIGGASGFDDIMLKELMCLGVDCFISAEFKNHMIVSALDNGFNIIDLGHYNSEVVVLDNVVSKLSEISADINVMKSENLCLI